MPTFDLRRRGYDVSAMPALVGGTGKATPYDFGYEGFKGVQVRGFWGGEPAVSKGEMLKELNSLPEGARGGIMWLWPGRGGHTIAFEKVNGKVIFIDPQKGKWGDNVLGKARARFGYSFYRTDHLELDENFDWSQVVRK